MPAQEITGNEVIGVPGQNLEAKELHFLVLQADGETNAATARTLGVQPADLPFIEASIRGKLGARTKAHMLARAFIFGVLTPRAFMALLLLLLMLFSQWADPRIRITKAMEYDNMAGSTLGPRVQDPRFIEQLPKPRTRL